jgi:hypothetical protein
MPARGALHGEVVQCEEPDWAPLLEMIGELLTGWLMWMHEVELSDGTRVHAFKHVTTRRYLHLDAGGRAFESRAESRYVQVRSPGAVAQAFVGWELDEPSEREVAELRSVVRELRACQPAAPRRSPSRE